MAPAVTSVKARLAWDLSLAGEIELLAGGLAVLA
jgi:hypothetical protein